jgi:hypothetical protein
MHDKERIKRTALLVHFSVYIHATLRCIHSIATLKRRNSLAHDQTPDILLLPSRRASPELVILLLGHALVGHLNVTKHLGVGGGDDACVNVGAGAEIVEDTSGDGVFDELESFLALWSMSTMSKDEGKETHRHISFPPCFKDGHGSQTTGAHRHVGEFVG